LFFRGIESLDLPEGATDRIILSMACIAVFAGGYPRGQHFDLRRRLGRKERRPLLEKARRTVSGAAERR
jgi:hypothetical protein